MLNKFINIICIITIIGATSCEKIINLSLEEVEPRIVIEGQVTNSAAIGSFVKLSKTKKVQTDNSVEPISGALVSIQENAGNFVSLIETQPGIYTNKSLIGSSNNTYNLKIDYNAQTITASCKMPFAVNLDSLIVEEFPQFGKTIKVITPVYTDPIGLGNHYNFLMYKNNKQIKDVFPVEDVLIDGRKISFPLFYSREQDEFVKDDVVDIEMMCIDKANYKYWYSLALASNGNPQAAPNNPISNIVGNAIGVFSANTYQKKSVVIK